MFLLERILRREGERFHGKSIGKNGAAHQGPYKSRVGASVPLLSLSLVPGEEQLPESLRHMEIRRTRARGSPRRIKSRRSEEHTSELQSQSNLVCRLLLEKKKNTREHTGERSQDRGPIPPRAVGLTVARSRRLAFALSRDLRVGRDGSGRLTPRYICTSRA